MYLVKIKYFYKSKSNRAQGALYFPYLGNKLFKPIRATIDDAILNGKYKLSNSKGGARHRKKKTELISSYFVETANNVYKLKTQYNHHGLISITTFLGMLNGYSSNKSGNLLIDAKETEFDEGKIGSLFRGIEKIDVSGYDLEEISFTELVGIKTELVEFLRRQND